MNDDIALDTNNSTETTTVDTTLQMKQSYENLSLDDCITKLLQDGKKHLSDVHTYKAVIGELQQVKGGAEENKKELQRMAYAKNLQLLEPNIQIMRNMLLYSEILCQKAIEYVSRISNNNNNNSSDTIQPDKTQVETLIQILDNVLILDYLKTWQAGLNNDFSMYRRAMQHVRKDYSLTDDETLRHFLISAHNINKGLKKDLQDKVNGFERVLIHVIKFCYESFLRDHASNGQGGANGGSSSSAASSSSSSSHQWMRVAVFCVFLVDTMLANSDKVDYAKKHIKFAKLSKLFDDHPRVLVYSTDLFMNVPYYLKTSPNFMQCAEDDSGFGCFCMK